MRKVLGSGDLEQGQLWCIYTRSSPDITHSDLLSTTVAMLKNKKKVLPKFSSSSLETQHKVIGGMAKPLLKL